MESKICKTCKQYKLLSHFMKRKLSRDGLDLHCKLCKSFYMWDIDHIIPVSSAKREEEIIKLNHYTNLQPLCSKINRYIKKNN